MASENRPTVTPPVFERSSGVLLHVTSLPGPYGIGDLGPSAYQWIDWLAETGTRFWQILPLGPTGYGDSPYSSPSSHAGNTDLISPELLVGEGLLPRSDLRPVGDLAHVDYPAVREYKTALLRIAFGNLTGQLHSEYGEFAERESHWAEPLGLYMALKEAHGGTAWTDWPEPLRQREPDALAAARTDLASEVAFHMFTQFLFHRQLHALRQRAAQRGVEIIGDVPLYVAPDSVDVWLDPELFTVGASGRPTHVAGVPPDMFSASGQRWGNPLYRWEAHRRTGFTWWAGRLRTFFSQSDVLRIDHFTGLVTYYDIEATNPTAMEGVWREGPGRAFFAEVEKAIGPLRVIVEDLGPAGQVVEDLRVELGYPGMEVLQELFVEKGPYGEIDEHRVVYTGTHDNDTALGRFEAETPSYRRRASKYVGQDVESFAEGLVQAAWASPGVIAIAPMQDLLGLGSEARMNYPSTPTGNWGWRMTPGSASPRLGIYLSELNQRYGRGT